MKRELHRLNATTLVHRFRHGVLSQIRLQGLYKPDQYPFPALHQHDAGNVLDPRPLHTPSRVPGNTPPSSTSHVAPTLPSVSSRLFRPAATWLLGSWCCYVGMVVLAYSTSATSLGTGYCDPALARGAGARYWRAFGRLPGYCCRGPVVWWQPAAAVVLFFNTAWHQPRPMP
jgi:hypothetical protein